MSVVVEVILTSERQGTELLKMLEQFKRAAGRQQVVCTVSVRYQYWI
jgi:hypothetical protein